MITDIGGFAMTHLPLVIARGFSPEDEISFARLKPCPTIFGARNCIHPSISSCPEPWCRGISGLKGFRWHPLTNLKVERGQ